MNFQVEKEQDTTTQDDETAADSFQQQDVGSDDEQDDEQPEETQIDVEIPYCKFSLGSEMDFVKLPNFLSVETKPFDLATYEDEFEEDEVMDDEGRSRLKLRVKFIAMTDSCFMCIDARGISLTSFEKCKNRHLSVHEFRLH